MSAPRIEEVRVGNEPNSVQRALSKLRTSVQAAVTTLHSSQSISKIVGPFRMNGADVDTTISHGLGRPVKWTVVDKDQNADVWRSQTKPADPLNTIILRTDFNTTAINGGLHITLEVK